jgi:hypothetical protein
VYLTVVGDRAELHDLDDFNRFEIRASRDNAVTVALETLGGTSDGTHGFVTREALARLAGPRGESPDWRTGLDGMADYAESHGWTDDEGRIRAHIVASEES